MTLFGYLIVQKNHLDMVRKAAYRDGQRDGYQRGRTAFDNLMFSLRVRDVSTLEQCNIIIAQQREQIVQLKKENVRKSKELVLTSPKLVGGEIAIEFKDNEQRWIEAPASDYSNSEPEAAV